MKIAIVNNMVPFIYGGAEFLADSLKDKLIEYGHEAEVIRIPFSWNPPHSIMDSIMAVRMIKLENTDKIIGLKFPSYYIEHPNKTLWLLHQFRQVYDLWGTQYQGLPDSQEGNAIKNSIINMDNKYLGDLEGRIYTNSQVVSDRLMKHNHISSKVLYPPLMEADKFFCKEYGDFIFYPSRVSHYKRQYLSIEAMKYTKTDVKLVIAGKGDQKSDEEYLFELIEKHNLSHKVKYINEFITQEYKAKLFSECLGNIYIPYDEDSYGYVTLEAYHSRKPVISCTDSGGTDVVVKDGLTGYMVESTPQQIAEAMDKLYMNKKNAQQMGVNGMELLNQIGMTWNNVIERLLV